MRNNQNNQLIAVVTQVDEKIAPFFLEKLPQLSPNVREILVKIVPYFTIFGVIVTALLLLLALGVTAFASPLLLMFGGLGGAQAISGSIIGLVFMAVQGGLDALAIPGLFSRQKSAWNLLFLANLVGAAHNLVSLNIVGLILGFLISFYLLYQIKSYYK